MTLQPTASLHEDRQTQALDAKVSLLSPFKTFAMVLIAGVFLAVLFVFVGCKPASGQLAANATIAEMVAINDHETERMTYIPQVLSSEELASFGIDEGDFYNWWLEDFSYDLGDVNLNEEKNAGEVNCLLDVKQLAPILADWSQEYTAWISENAIALQTGQFEGDVFATGRDLLQEKFSAVQAQRSDINIAVELVNDDWEVTPQENNPLYEEMIGSGSLAAYFQAPELALNACGIELIAPQSAQEGQSDDQSGEQSDDQSSE